MTKILIFGILICLNLSAFAESWKKIAEEDEIVIFSKNVQTGVLPFKANGRIDANIETIVKILRDHKNKHQWSPKLKSVKLHEKTEHKEEYIFSEFYSTPWPASDREFLLKGEIVKKNELLYQITAKSVDLPRLMDDSHIQANVQALNLQLTQISKDITDITFEFHGDMKGWMPNWLINIITKKWPMRFIQALRRRVDSQDLLL